MFDMTIKQEMQTEEFLKMYLVSEKLHFSSCMYFNFFLIFMSFSKNTGWEGSNKVPQ